MASYCLLCDKKLGFFSPWGEDILTGKSSNRLCEDCYNKAEAIIKKIETKIPIEPQDIEGFSEGGEKIIREYIELYGGIETETEYLEEKSEIKVGDAITAKFYEINDEETNAIFEKMKEMKESEIEAFLEGIVSENETADSFMREILSLNDENLAAIISEQRELYNNAEWAYILHVEYMRKTIDQALESAKEAEPDHISEALPFDQAEFERMKEVFGNESEEELKKISEDMSYTKEAREAAKFLINK